MRLPELESLAPAALGLALFIAGCSAQAPDSADGGSDVPPCAQADDVEIGFEKASSDGAITISLSDADPESPATGDNIWTIVVEDAAASPIAGAALEVSGWMPEHGHGLNAAVIVTELGQGSYRLEPIKLVMPSLWQITISVTPSGGETKSVLFEVCVAAT